MKEHVGQHVVDGGVDFVPIQHATCFGITDGQPALPKTEPSSHVFLFQSAEARDGEIPRSLQIENLN